MVARQGEGQQKQRSLAYAWATRLIGLSFDEADSDEGTPSALGADLPAAAGRGGEAAPAAEAAADDMQSECAGGCGGQGPALQQSGVLVSAPQPLATPARRNKQLESRQIVEVDGDVEAVTVSLSGMEGVEGEREAVGSVERAAVGGGGGGGGGRVV
jgi:hypothetical protein